MKYRYLIYVNFSIRTDILSYFMLPILLIDFYRAARTAPTSGLPLLLTSLLYSLNVPK